MVGTVFGLGSGFLCSSLILLGSQSPPYIKDSFSEEETKDDSKLHERKVI